MILRLALLAFALLAQAVAAPEPPHLMWAERLVAELTPENNAYAWSPTFVVWAEDGNGAARNRSVCSSFVSRDLMRAYGLTRDDLEKRFGTRNPQAKDYYDTIAAQRGFTLITRVDQFMPGDILAAKYEPGSRPTGHVMILDGAPVPRRPTEPLEPGTSQYEVAVIDSSSSFHGPHDTRHLEAKTHAQGVGRGTLRLYADASGALAGYSWSLSSRSRYYGSSEHQLVVGRFNTLPFSPAAKSGSGDGQSEDEAPGRIPD